jgi:hypothetical protein
MAVVCHRRHRPVCGGIATWLCVSSMLPAGTAEPTGTGAAGGWLAATEGSDAVDAATAACEGITRRSLKALLAPAQEGAAESLWAREFHGRRPV